jgi:hypothetical protein
VHYLTIKGVTSESEIFTYDKHICSNVLDASVDMFKTMIDELMSSFEIEEAIRITTEDHLALDWNPLIVLSKGVEPDTTKATDAIPIMLSMFDEILSEVVAEVGEEMMA